MIVITLKFSSIIVLITQIAGHLKSKYIKMLLHESDCLFPNATPPQMYQSPTDTENFFSLQDSHPLENAVFRPVLLIKLRILFNCQLMKSFQFFINHFYVALFSVLEWTHCPPSCCMWFWVSDYCFTVCYLTATEVVYWQCCLVVAWLVPHETAVISAHVPRTPCNHAPVYGVTSFKAAYIGRMCV